MDMNHLPSYFNISKEEWAIKEEKAYSLISECRCCPHYCRVNRINGEKGRCGAGLELFIASADPHYGEEPPISGWRGSGAIFFTFCPMKCIYCQNYPFSQLGQGRQKCIDELVSLMIYLQDKGCHNINLVTPAHFVPQILLTIKKAVDKGFKIPIVYNTSSYESPETLSLMEGIIDIYLADMRYDDPENSFKYSNVKDYPQVSRVAVKEMFSQVGHLMVDEYGIAQRGLIVRHLVLPGSIAGSREIFRFISQEISHKVHVSLMSQYFPSYRASEYPELNRPITKKEYKDALEMLEKFGLTEGWRQGI